MVPFAKHLNMPQWILGKSGRD